MPPKPDLILVDMDEYVVSEFVTSVPVVTTNKSKTSESKPKSVSEPIIKDWVCNSEDENETETKSKQRKPSFAKLELQDKGVIDSGCSRHMTGNMSYLSEYEEIDGGYVAFKGDPKGGKITVKGKISIDTECVVLSSDFKLLDDSQVLLRVPRKDNMYSIDLKNIAPSRVQAIAATDDSPAVPEHTTVETPMNMSPENKAHFESEKEAIPLILTGIGDEIYSTVDAYQTA
nr:hypothetical protein [Tanacetum cinerariifolium]